MTSKKLAAKYGVNVMKIKRPRKQGVDKSYYTAFRGGNGTGEPVVELADAYSLASLDQRLAKILAA